MQDSQNVDGGGGYAIATKKKKRTGKDAIHKPFLGSHDQLICPVCRQVIMWSKNPLTIEAEDPKKQERHIMWIS